jgi:hypothetical protein
MQKSVKAKTYACYSEKRGKACVERADAVIASNSSLPRPWMYPMLGVRAGERCDVLWNEYGPSISVPRRDRTTSHVLPFHNKLLVVLPGSRIVRTVRKDSNANRSESNAKARLLVMNLISSTSADDHINKTDFKLQPSYQ